MLGNGQTTSHLSEPIMVLFTDANMCQSISMSSSHVKQDEVGQDDDSS